MHGDEKWVHRPESAFSEKTKGLLVWFGWIFFAIVMAGVYFLWRYIKG